MNISNKSTRAISVPLPHGKTLFLGVGKTGQITAKSAQHPQLLALVEAGDLELDDESRKRNSVPSDGPIGRSASPGGGPASDFRRTGDR